MSLKIRDGLGDDEPPGVYSSGSCSVSSNSEQEEERTNEQVLRKAQAIQQQGKKRKSLC